MKLISAARKGGGSLFLSCTRETAAAFSPWQKKLSQDRGRPVLLPPNFFLPKEFQPFKTPPVQTPSSCVLVNVTLECRGGNQHYFYFWLSKHLAFNSQVFISLPKLPPVPAMLSMILFSGRGRRKGIELNALKMERPEESQTCIHCHISHLSPPSFLAPALLGRNLTGNILEVENFQ